MHISQKPCILRKSGIKLNHIKIGSFTIVACLFINLVTNDPAFNKSPRFGPTLILIFSKFHTLPISFWAGSLLIASLVGILAHCLFGRDLVLWCGGGDQDDEAQGKAQRRDDDVLTSGSLG
jgi:hypothetical protein